MLTYVRGTGEVTAADREALREKWESSVLDDDDDEDDLMFNARWASSDPFDLAMLDALAHPRRAELYMMQKEPPKVDRYGELVGITPRLIKVSIPGCLHRIKTDSLHPGLQRGCRRLRTRAAASVSGRTRREMSGWRC